MMPDTKLIILAIYLFECLLSARPCAGSGVVRIDLLCFLAVQGD